MHRIAQKNPVNFALISEEMKILRIHDLLPDGGYLAVDLRHVLELLGHRGISSQWSVSGVWATGEASRDLESLDDSSPISGAELKRMAENVTQVIDGRFDGRVSPDHPPWIIIVADDSTFYDVHCDDPDVLKAIRERFEQVEEVKETA